LSLKALSARSNCSGSFLRLLAARRKIPEQALALKKYRCGTSPVTKISDNEDAAAALGNSEVLSVKNSVGEPIPELPQLPEKDSKRPSAVA
jgi:hypothetical protein